MIKVRGLEKRYGSTWALRGLNFDVPKGSIYGFIGENGAGKTTTLRILAGLLAPDAGTAVVAGYDVVQNPRPVKQRMGYMPDFFGVYDDLKVTEYLEFYAEASGLFRAKAQRLRDEVLDLVGLSDKGNVHVDSLSRGMKQRLCLARALMHDPEVLLLDEPASGLDPLARVEMRELMKKLGKMGKTILISSHILSELADLCTHVGIIKQGVMVAQGTVEEVLQKGLRRELSIRFLDEDTQKVAEVLSARPEVHSVSTDGLRVEVEIEGGPEKGAALLEFLIQAGYRVTSFADTTSSLEDTYLRLAGGGGEGEED